MSQRILVGSCITAATLLGVLIVWGIYVIVDQAANNTMNIIHGGGQVHQPHTQHGHVHSAPVDHFAAARMEAMEATFGIGRDIDLEEAESRLRDLQRQGDAVSAGLLYDVIAISPTRRSRNREANEIWREDVDELWQLCEAGNLDAIFAVAYAYSSVEDDEDWSSFIDRTSRRLLAEGHIPGMMLRAAVLAKGIHAEKDLDAAAAIYRQLHDDGVVRGTSGLGWLQAEEEFSGYDEAEAVRLLQDAAHRGSKYSWTELAEIYIDDEMDAGQLAEAERYLRVSIDEGSIEAIVKLADLLLRDAEGQAELAEVRGMLEQAAPEIRAIRNFFRDESAVAEVMSEERAQEKAAETEEDEMLVLLDELFVELEEREAGH